MLPAAVPVASYRGSRGRSEVLPLVEGSLSTSIFIRAFEASVYPKFSTAFGIGTRAAHECNLISNLDPMDPPYVGGAKIPWLTEVAAI